MRISAVDRKVLNSIQKDIPFSPEPFKILSRQIGITQERFLQRLRHLKDRGIVRNFTAGLNHGRLGFVSTLVGLRLPSGKIDSIAQKLSAYPEVTHCYLREGEYNLWAVFICAEEKRLRVLLNRLARQVGKDNILNLKTKRRFKLKTELRV